MKLKKGRRERPADWCASPRTQRFFCKNACTCPSADAGYFDLATALHHCTRTHHSPNCRCRIPIPHPRYAGTSAETMAGQCQRREVTMKSEPQHADMQVIASFNSSMCSPPPPLQDLPPSRDMCLSRYHPSHIEFFFQSIAFPLIYRPAHAAANQEILRGGLHETGSLQQHCPRRIVAMGA